MTVSSSTRPVVAVTSQGLPGEGLRRLAEVADVRQWPDRDRRPTADELDELVRGATAIIPLGTRITDRVLAAAGEGLRIVATPTAGYDAIDVPAAAQRDILVTNAPGILAETTADLTFALILMARRALVPAMDALRRGDWGRPGHDNHLGLDVYGSELGLVGYGEIGRAVARRAAGFGMTVRHTFSRRPTDEFSSATDLDELLAVSDIVSLHVPLAANTERLIDADALARMKPGATLINTARGGVVDEAALLHALDSGQLYAAGLDVYAHEPVLDPDHPLVRHPRVVALPHVGSATFATRAALVDHAVDNVMAVLSGRPALSPVPSAS